VFIVFGKLIYYVCVIVFLVFIFTEVRILISDTKSKNV
jgi:hypothetical protein